jgi:tyrosine-protein kinase Etk/Wzc
MEILTILQVLWRRKLLMVLIIVLSLVGAMIIALALPDTYTVVARVRVLTVEDSLRISIDYTNRLNNTFLNIISSDYIMNKLMERLNLEEEPRFSLRFVPNTEILEISADTHDPSLVNTLVDILIEEGPELYYGNRFNVPDAILADLEAANSDLEDLLSMGDRVIATGQDTDFMVALLEQKVRFAQQQIFSLQEDYNSALMLEEIGNRTISVYEYAKVPEKPSNLWRGLMLLAGVFTGLVTSVPFAFIAENLDTTLYDIDFIEDFLDKKALAYIPKVMEGTSLIQFNASFTREVDAFRLLRRNLFKFVDSSTNGKSFLVVSAERETGKSFIIANLAQVMSLDDKSILLIDSNMRKPSLHEYFNLNQESGLRDYLEGELELGDIVKSTDAPNLKLITVGHSTFASTELLASNRMKDLLAELEDSFDVVLIDTPSLCSASDALELSNYVDQTLFVVSLYQTRREDLTHLTQYSDMNKTQQVTLVINRANR